VRLSDVSHRTARSGGGGYSNSGVPYPLVTAIFGTNTARSISKTF
jgi:hypothetical protein